METDKNVPAFVRHRIDIHVIHEVRIAVRLLALSHIEKQRQIRNIPVKDILGAGIYLKPVAQDRPAALQNIDTLSASRINQFGIHGHTS